MLDAPDLADSLGEAVRVGVEELLEVRALLEGDGRLELVHGRPELRLGHGQAGGLPELGEHGLRRTLGREEPRPDVELGLGVSQLLEGGDLGQRGDPLVPPAGERAELARLDLGQNHRGPGGESIHVTSEESGQGGAGAGVGHVTELDPRRARQELHGHVQRAVDPR